jgi:hypothetical protein
LPKAALDKMLKLCDPTKKVAKEKPRMALTGNYNNFSKITETSLFTAGIGKAKQIKISHKLHSSMKKGKTQYSR